MSWCRFLSHSSASRLPPVNPPIVNNAPPRTSNYCSNDNRYNLKVATTFCIAITNLVVAALRINAEDDLQVMTKTLLPITWSFFTNATLNKTNTASSNPNTTPSNLNAGVRNTENKIELGFQVLSALTAIPPSLLAAISLANHNERLIDISQKIMLPFLGASVFFRMIPELIHCSQIGTSVSAINLASPDNVASQNLVVLQNNASNQEAQHDIELGAGSLPGVIA